MEAEENTQNYFPLFLFNLIGAFSSVSLFFIVLYTIASMIQGDFNIWNNFIEVYPGSQPFLIFIFPIIIIASPLWLYTMINKKRRL